MRRHRCHTHTNNFASDRSDGSDDDVSEADMVVQVLRRQVGTAVRKQMSLVLGYMHLQLLVR